MSSRGYDNLDNDAVWNNYAKPAISIVTLGCVIILASIWPILFGVFTFQTDVACADTELLTFATISFWLLLVISILSIINAIIQITTFDIIPQTLILPAISCFMSTTGFGISLFVFIRGLIVIQNASPQFECEALYYLILVYIILYSIAILFLFISILCLCCCACFGLGLISNASSNTLSNARPQNSEV